MGDLGQRLYLEKSWVSRAVDSLLKAGLVEKSTNPLDARSWIVALTPEGHRTVAELNRTLDEHAEQLLGHLPAAQQVLIQQSLASLLQALRDDTAATCCLPVSNVSNPKP
jgi:DNA-binding MarR family transcriptional regulator